MNNNFFTKSIKDKILNKITGKKIKMKPRSYFILKTIIPVLGIIFAFLLTIFLASFIIFLLRVSGILSFPAFGFRGVGIFFMSLPWLLVIFMIIFVIILEFLAKKFSVVYRKPLLYSIAGILILALFLGFLIAKTPIHQKLLKDAQEGGLPIAGPFYRGPHIHSPEGVYFGKVLSIADDGFKIETKEGKSFSIIISSETRSPFTKDIKEGDMVMVIGDKDDSTIKAFGVRKITARDSIDFYRRRPAMPPPSPPQFRR